MKLSLAKKILDQKKIYYCNAFDLWQAEDEHKNDYDAMLAIKRVLKHILHGI